VPKGLTRFVAAVTGLAWPVLAHGQFKAVARLESFRNTVALDTMTVRLRTEHEAPPTVVWPLLLESLRSVDAELATAGGAAHGWAGTLYLRPPRRLGGKPLSYYLDCGTGMTGPHADTDRVSLAFGAFVDSLPNQRTRIGWALVASAVRREGFSSPPITCESLGNLEQAVANGVNLRLAQRP
jgi:hypothetical protein